MSGKARFGLAGKGSDGIEKSEMVRLVNKGLDRRVRCGKVP